MMRPLHEVWGRDDALSGEMVSSGRVWDLV